MLYVHCASATFAGRRNNLPTLLALCNLKNLHPPKNQGVQVTIRKQIKMLNPLQTICFMFRNSIYSKGVT